MASSSERIKGWMVASKKPWIISGPSLIPESTRGLFEPKWGFRASQIRLRSGRLLTCNWCNAGSES